MNAFMHEVEAAAKHWPEHNDRGGMAFQKGRSEFGIRATDYHDPLNFLLSLKMILHDTQVPKDDVLSFSQFIQDAITINSVVVSAVDAMKTRRTRRPSLSKTSITRPPKISGGTDITIHRRPYYILYGQLLMVASRLYFEELQSITIRDEETLTVTMKGIGKAPKIQYFNIKMTDLESSIIDWMQGHGIIEGPPSLIRRFIIRQNTGDDILAEITLPGLP
jgi:hypothetical protein